MKFNVCLFVYGLYIATPFKNGQFISVEDDKRDNNYLFPKLDKNNIICDEGIIWIVVWIIESMNLKNKIEPLLAKYIGETVVFFNYRHSFVCLKIV